MSLSCESAPLNDQNQQSQHNCSIGNVFIGPGKISLRVNLIPTSRIIGNEDSLSINFTVGSLNPESLETIVDDSNFIITQLMFEARANISIDNG